MDARHRRPATIDRLLTRQSALLLRRSDRRRTRQDLAAIAAAPHLSLDVRADALAAVAGMDADAAEAAARPGPRRATP